MISCLLIYLRVFHRICFLKLGERFDEYYQIFLEDRTLVENHICIVAILYRKAKAVLIKAFTQLARLFHIELVFDWNEVLSPAVIYDSLMGEPQAYESDSPIRLDPWEYTLYLMDNTKTSPRDGLLPDGAIQVSSNVYGDDDGNLYLGKW